MPRPQFGPKELSVLLNGCYKKMNNSSPKIIVVGAGLSGLMATIHLAKEGQKVLLMSSLPASRSDTSSRHAGFSTACNPTQKKDSPQSHFIETIYGGDFLGDQEMVRMVCQKSPFLVQLLERMGMIWDRTDEGNLKFYSSEGSLYQRCLHGGWNTGQRLLNVLDSQISRLEVDRLVTRLEGWEFLSVILDNQDKCRGIVALDHHSMELQIFKADGVVFCTGGLGALFERTTGSSLSTGSAISSLYQQGAILANLEFIQTTLATDDQTFRAIDVMSLTGYLGGCLWTYRDGKPSYFLEEKFPQYKNLIPQDVLGKIFNQLVYQQGLGVQGNPFVYLDFRDNQEVWKNPFNTQLAHHIQKLCGINPQKEPLPVSPAVSYSCGGLYVNEKHQTNIAGVFAAGECQFQYHGAYALESNIFLSSLWGGMQAANSVIEYKEGLGKSAGEIEEKYFNLALKQAEFSFKQFEEFSGSENGHRLEDELKRWMTQNLIHGRENKKIEKTIEKIEELKIRFTKVSLQDHSSWANFEQIFLFRFKNRLELAHAICTAALYRNESRGAHDKPEYPKRDDTRFLKNTKISFTGNKPKIEYEDVICKIVKPIERKYG